MARDLPSAPDSDEVHDRCRAAARAAAQVLGDVWTAPHLDRGGGGMLRRDSGDSTEFHDHRLYSPGDDPRRINWAAYARTGQLSLKLFRQEGRPLIDCLFDASPSMWQPDEKAARSLELLYFVVETAAAQQAGLQVWALAGSKCVPIPGGLLAAGTKWIEQLPEALGENETIDTHPVPLRAGSRRILISDLLYPVDPDDLLRPLTARNGGASVLAPWHEEESNPEWRGVCQLDDSESLTMRELEFDSAATRSYLDAYARHFENWQRAAQRNATALGRIPCKGTLAAALGAQTSNINPAPGAAI